MSSNQSKISNIRANFENLMLDKDLREALWRSRGEL